VFFSEHSVDNSNSLQTSDNRFDLVRWTIHIQLFSPSLQRGLTGVSRWLPSIRQTKTDTSKQTLSLTHNALIYIVTL